MSRPVRVSALKASERIKCVYEWENCEETSTLFQEAATRMEEEFLEPRNVDCSDVDEDEDGDVSVTSCESSESYDSSFVSKSQTDEEETDYLSCIESSNSYESTENSQEWQNVHGHVEEKNEDYSQDSDDHVWPPLKKQKCEHDEPSVPVDDFMSTSPTLDDSLDLTILHDPSFVDDEKIGSGWDSAEVEMEPGENGVDHFHSISTNQFDHF